MEVALAQRERRESHNVASSIHMSATDSYLRRPSVQSQHNHQRQKSVRDIIDDFTRESAKNQEEEFIIHEKIVASVRSITGIGQDSAISKNPSRFQDTRKQEGKEI